MNEAVVPASPRGELSRPKDRSQLKSGHLSVVDLGARGAERLEFMTSADSENRARPFHSVVFLRSPPRPYARRASSAFSPK
eukprot:15460299-Alexandrium_andersonii.AAC.1